MSENKAADEIKGAAKRFLQRAAAAGLEVAIKEHAEPTRTAEEAAVACGCQVAQIVKSLVFRGATSGRPYLLLVAGNNRVDQKGVAAHLGEKLDRPDAAYVRDITGYAIGGIPPLGHDTPLATYVDQDLLLHDLIWAAAGTPNAVFAAKPADLVAAAGATVVSVT